MPISLLVVPSISDYVPKFLKVFIIEIINLKISFTECFVQTDILNEITDS